MTNRGAVSHGHASRSCWAVHAGVGRAVTFRWTMRRLACDNTTKTNNPRNVAVGTVKKSTEASGET